MPGVNLNLKDNYGNTPIMMGVKYGTSDVLMVMLNCRYISHYSYRKEINNFEYCPVLPFYSL